MVPAIKVHQMKGEQKNVVEFYFYTSTSILIHSGTCHHANDPCIPPNKIGTNSAVPNAQPKGILSAKAYTKGETTLMLHFSQAMLYFSAHMFYF